MRLRVQSLRYSSGFIRRHIGLNLAVSALGAVASLLFGKAAGSEGANLVLLGAGTFCLLLLVLSPTLMSTLAVIEDFMRLSRVDTALLGGLTWHPDISISGLDLPVVLTEGDQNQTVAVTLQYKPLVTSYRGSLAGIAELWSEPPLLDFPAEEFLLSPDEPEQRVEFGLNSKAFGNAALGEMLKRSRGTIPEDGRLTCELGLRIETPWEVRTVHGTPERRKVELSLGTIGVQLIDARRWVERMASDRYLTVLPNDLAFNPVLTTSDAPGLGTNVVVATQSWHAAIQRNEPEAQFLLLVAARLLALQVATDPDPVIEDETDGSHEPLGGAPAAAGAAAGADPDAGALADKARAAQRADLDTDGLRIELRRRTAEALEEIRRAGIARRASEWGSGATQTYRVMIQDLGEASGLEDDAVLALTLLGFGDRTTGGQGRHVLIADKRAEGGPARNESSLHLDANVFGPHLISRIVDQRRQRPNFANCIAVTLPAGADPSVAGGFGQEPPTVEEIRNLLSDLAAVLQSSQVVTSGFYVQPQPVTKHFWLDLVLCSSVLEAAGLTEQVQRAALGTAHAVSVVKRSAGLSIVNCCAPDGQTSDHRFAPLRLLPSQSWRDVPIWPGRYRTATHKWDIDVPPEARGDSVIISALSNDYQAFGQLIDVLTKDGRPISFVPFFGPIDPPDQSWGGLFTSASLTALPLLVWDRGRSMYIPSTSVKRYAALWTILERHERGS